MRLGIFHLIGLLGTPLIIAWGQILFKAVSVDARPDSIGRLLSNPYLWLAFLIYGGATIVWVFVIRGIPISRAYLFMALSFVYLPILSAIVLGERLTLQFALGVLLICGGIIVSLSA